MRPNRLMPSTCCRKQTAAAAVPAARQQQHTIAQQQQAVLGVLVSLLHCVLVQKPVSAARGTGCQHSTISV